MPADLFDRRAAGLPVPEAARPKHDPAFDARPRFVRLRDALVHAHRQRPSGNEPELFFFDPKRQAELEAAGPARPDRFAGVSDLIAAEMPALIAAVEVRRVARATGGLLAAARALAPRCAAARAFAELLAVPDDEAFVALNPADRTGVRLHLRGAADAAQLYRLLAPSMPGPAFQLFLPTALRPDGTLTPGFAGCEHWLWPTQPLAAIPRVNGERVVLVGPAVVNPSLDAEPRFPTLAAECESLQPLSPFLVAERLSRLTGRPVPVTPPAESAPQPTTPVARAA